MLRKIALVLLPFALFATACGSSASKSSTNASTPSPAVTVAASTTQVNPRATLAALAVTPQPTRRSTGTTGTSSDAASALFNTVNPFQLLGDLNGQPASGNVDPNLKSVLLRASDLPAGFASMGDFTYNVPSQYGTVQLAANIFASGDMSSSQFGGMVMSAALALPQQALDQFQQQGGFDQLRSFSNADLQQLQGAAQQVGVGFSDLHVMDGSGLGDGGVGMHMVMDFNGLLSSLGAPSGENPFAGGLAMDMYMFLRGDHMFMVMVMWPGGQPSKVDSRALANALNTNASGTF